MTTKEAREALDSAMYDYLESLGYDATDFDYWYINEMLDDLKRYKP